VFGIAIAIHQRVERRAFNLERSRRDEAAHAVQRLRAIEPELTISAFFERIPVPLEATARTYAEALRRGFQSKAFGMSVG
jgi:hypothetical protein